MVFWITSRMKTKREQIDDEIVIIKLFASNYARDLIFILMDNQYQFSKVN